MVSPILVHVGVGQRCRSIDGDPPAILRFVRIHVGVGQCCRAMDGDSPAISARSSGVVMDIAAFKVCHPVGGDKDATALQAKKWSA